jgi:hypothetical protein
MYELKPRDPLNLIDFNLLEYPIDMPFQRITRMSRADLRIHHPQPHEVIVPHYAAFDSTGKMSWFIATHIDSCNTNLKRERKKQHLVATLVSQASGNSYVGVGSRRGSTWSLGFRIPDGDIDLAKPSLFHLFIGQTNANAINEGNQATSVEFLVSPPATTSLTAAATINAAQFTVKDSNFATAPFVVQVGTELIKVTAVAATTWTIVRGYNGTTAAQHPNKSLVVFRWAIPATTIAAVDAPSLTITVASATDFPSEVPFSVTDTTAGVNLTITGIAKEQWTVLAINGANVADSLVLQLPVLPTTAINSNLLTVSLFRRALRRAFVKLDKKDPVATSLVSALMEITDSLDRGPSGNQIPIVYPLANSTIGGSFTAWGQNVSPDVTQTMGIMYGTSQQFSGTYIATGTPNAGTWALQFTNLPDDEYTLVVSNASNTTPGTDQGSQSNITVYSAANAPLVAAPATPPPPPQTIPPTGP